MIKATSNEVYKGNGKHYPKIHAFGVEGRPVDLDFSVDLETQNDLFIKAGKMIGQTVQVVADMSFYEKRANFNIVSLEPVASTAAAAR